MIINSDLKRQLRIWVAMLYPVENIQHQKFLNWLEVTNKYHYAYIEHIGKNDLNGEIINKPHVHLIIWFENPKRLDTLFNEFYDYSKIDLSDFSHLFKSFTDFKKNRGKQLVKSFNNIDDYINYCTHRDNDNKFDKYTIDDFVTNCEFRIVNALNRDFTKTESLLNLIEFIEHYKRNNINECVTYNFKDWFICCNNNGYGDIFFKNWNKIKDILNCQTIVINKDRDNNV